MAEISIIIPVYNIPEKILHKSIVSVINQTFSDIEIIVVDDGSEKICSNYCDDLCKEMRG